MDTLTLLERAGFTRENGRAVYGFTINGTLHEVVVVDAERGGAPTSYTTNFRAISPRLSDPESKFFDIVLETDDARDVVAFASAAECDVIVAELGDNSPEERTFSWEYTAVHNAFADIQYGDWQGAMTSTWPHNRDGRAVIVTLPRDREWAAEYLEWRDGYCEALLGQTPVAAV